MLIQEHILSQDKESLFSYNSYFSCKLRTLKYAWVDHKKVEMLIVTCTPWMSYRLEYAASNRAKCKGMLNWFAGRELNH